MRHFPTTDESQSVRGGFSSDSVSNISSSPCTVSSNGDDEEEEDADIEEI